MFFLTLLETKDNLLSQKTNTFVNQKIDVILKQGNFYRL